MPLSGSNWRPGSPARIFLTRSFHLPHAPPSSLKLHVEIGLGQIGHRQAGQRIPHQAIRVVDHADPTALVARFIRVAVVVQPTTFRDNIRPILAYQERFGNVLSNLGTIEKKYHVVMETFLRPMLQLPDVAHHVIEQFVRPRVL